MSNQGNEFDLVWYLNLDTATASPVQPELGNCGAFDHRGRGSPLGNSGESGRLVVGPGLKGGNDC